MNVRLILGFVDYQDTLGGVSNYAGWRGREKNDFFTDPQIISDFKETIDTPQTGIKTKRRCFAGRPGMRCRSTPP